MHAHYHMSYKDRQTWVFEEGRAKAERERGEGAAHVGVCGEAGDMIYRPIYISVRGCCKIDKE